MAESGEAEKPGKLSGEYRVPKAVVWTFVALMVADGINHDLASLLAAGALIVCVIRLAWLARREMKVGGQDG